MAIETTKPRTRRAILLGAAGAVAATAAAAVARPIPTLAAGDDGHIVHVGDRLEDIQSTTILQNLTSNYLILDVETAGGIAIYAGAQSGTALRSESGSGAGVAAGSITGVAVDATSDTGVGVYGRSTENSGIVGSSGGESRLPAPRKTGVYGVAAMAGGTGVVGRAPTGRGGSFSGGEAQLRLVPSSAVTHPSSGQAGDLFVDKSHRLWFCLGATSWKRVQLV